MKILILLQYPYDERSAMASNMRNYARGLCEAGAEAAIIGVDNSGSDDGRWHVDDLGVRYCLVPSSPQRLPFLQRRLSRHFATRLRQVLDEQDVDCVIMYGQGRWVFKLVHRLCQREGIPALMVCVEWPRWPRSIMSKQWLALLDQFLCRRLMMPKLNGIIGITQLWESFARKLNIPCIRIPPLGEDVGHSRSPMPPRRKEPFVVTYLGVMGPRDLPFTMLQGVQLAQQRGIDARLVVIGKVEQTSTGKRAKRYVERHKELHHNVVFTGWVSDEELERRLEQTDTLVLIRPDNWEVRACFPFRLSEYLLTGRPVILSKAGDLPLYFRHRENAWILPPGNCPEELAEALSHLARHPEEAQEIGRRGRETALSELSYRKHGHRLLEFIQTLSIARSSARGQK